MEFFKNYFLTVKGILFSPKEFFEEVSWDSGWKEPIIFFSVSAAIFALAMSLMASTFISLMAALSPAIAQELREMGLPLYMLVYFLSVFVSAFIGSHIISAATTFALHMLGGKGSFQRTYMALSCAWVVLLYEWVPFIGWIASLYFFYLAYLGLSKAHEVSGWRGIAGLLLGPGTLAVVVGTVMFFAFMGMFFSAMNHAGGDDGSYMQRMYEENPEARKIMDRYRKGSED